MHMYMYMYMYVSECTIITMSYMYSTCTCTLEVITEEMYIVYVQSAVYWSDVNVSMVTAGLHHNGSGEACYGWAKVCVVSSV